MKIDYIDECHAGDEVKVFTSIKLADGKKLDLYHELKDTAGNLRATASQFLLHVDLHSRKSCEPVEPLATHLNRLKD